MPEIQDVTDTDFIVAEYRAREDVRITFKSALGSERADKRTRSRE